ncbi:hypothetical protein Ancab_031602 [Ancistrocladus abbreviatus]
MEVTGVAKPRHRRSPSSDRLLRIITPSGSPTIFSGLIDSTIAGGDELNEAELFWTGDSGDSTDTNHRPTSPTDSGHRFHRGLGNNQTEDKFGILAALPDYDRNRIQSRPVISRRGFASSSSARIIPSIPKPPANHQEREYDNITQSLPCGSRKFQNSVPVSIPKALMERHRRLNGIDGGDEEEDDDGEPLPPHEIVALKVKATSSSVLEGAGRTLKGRDLRQVRNTVWRQTGFLD